MDATRTTTLIDANQANAAAADAVVKAIVISDEQRRRRRNGAQCSKHCLWPIELLGQLEMLLLLKHQRNEIWQDKTDLPSFCCCTKQVSDPRSNSDQWPSSSNSSTLIVVLFGTEAAAAAVVKQS